MRTIQLLVAVGAASILAGYGFAAATGTRAAINAQESSDDILGDLFGMQHADAASVDYFLKLDGIPGESTAEGHENEIEILSFSWGLSNSGSAQAAGGGGAGKVSFSDINFQKALDKASPKLLESCASGKHIPSATFTIVRTDTEGRSSSYYTITLHDVLVSSYQQSGSAGGDRPTESLSLNFSKVEVEYIPQNPDGTFGEPVKAGWDLKKNVKV